MDKLFIGLAVIVLILVVVFHINGLGGSGGSGDSRDSGASEGCVGPTEQDSSSIFHVELTHKVIIVDGTERELEDAKKCIIEGIKEGKKIVVSVTPTGTSYDKKQLEQLSREQGIDFQWKR